MKATEIRASNEQDLNLRVSELKKELMKLNAEAAVSNPKNPGKIKQIKKTIARIHTILNEKSKTKMEVN